MFYDKLFAPTPVNTGRQSELDLLKAFTIFEMIVMHLCEHSISHNYSDYAYCDLTIAKLTIFNMFYLAGPLSFIFSMGCTVPFSRHQDTKSFFTRGLKLIVAWQVLNLIRSPLFAYLYTVNVGGTFWSWFKMFIFANDILFFAGAFFLLLALFKKLDFRLSTMLIITAVIYIGTTLAGAWNEWLPSWSHRALCGLVYIHGLSTFPLANVAIIAMLGVGFGHFLRRCHNKTRLYALIGVPGLVLCGVLAWQIYQHGGFAFDAQRAALGNPLSCHIAAPLALICGLALLTLRLNVFYLLTLPKFGESIRAAIGWISANLTEIYFAHWLFLPLWKPKADTTYKFSLIEIFGIVLITYALSIAAVALYRKILSWGRSSKAAAR